MPSLKTCLQPAMLGLFCLLLAACSVTLGGSAAESAFQAEPPAGGHRVGHAYRGGFGQ
jgi:hypothetical protein